MNAQLLHCVCLLELASEFGKRSRALACPDLFTPTFVGVPTIRILSGVRVFANGVEGCSLPGTSFDSAR